MNKKLEYDYKTGQECIETTIGWNRFNEQYYNLIAERLNCEISDLALLQVHPDHEDIDEEGYMVQSFFPKGAQIEIKELYDNLTIKNDKNEDVFCFGTIYEVTYEGEKFIGDQNASPIGLYGKFEKEQ